MANAATAAVMWRRGPEALGADGVQAAEVGAVDAHGRRGGEALQEGRVVDARRDALRVALLRADAHGAAVACRAAGRATAGGELEGEGLDPAKGLHLAIRILAMQEHPKICSL